MVSRPNFMTRWIVEHRVCSRVARSGGSGLTGSAPGWLRPEGPVRKPRIRLVSPRLYPTV